MIVLISPAKTLDLNPSHTDDSCIPRFLTETEQLIKVLQKKSVKSLQKLMDISQQLAEVNADRFATFTTPFTHETAKQAVLMFKGDVYTGLQADTFESDELEFAQRHLRILSGLYGLLKPLDLIHPYRLEMGTPLKIGHKKNLYEFWGKKITELINRDLIESGSEFIINLASQEYFHAVKSNLLKGQLINIHFKEQRGDQLKVISFNAKKARGKLAREIILQKISTPEDLKEISVDDYIFVESISSTHNWVFVKS